MVIVVCSVCGYLDGRDHTIHRFPEDVQRCNQWAELIERHDLMDLAPGECHKLHGLCAIHFLREDFDGDKLKDDAKPLCRRQNPSIPASPTGQRSPSTSESLSISVGSSSPGSPSSPASPLTWESPSTSESTSTSGSPSSPGSPSRTRRLGATRFKSIKNHLNADGRRIRCARHMTYQQYRAHSRAMDAAMEAAEELALDVTVTEVIFNDTAARARDAVERVVEPGRTRQHRERVAAYTAIARRAAEAYHAVARSVADADVVVAAAAARAIATVAETDGPSRDEDAASGAAMCLERMAYEHFLKPPPSPSSSDDDGAAAPDPGPTEPRDPWSPVTRDPWSPVTRDPWSPGRESPGGSASSDSDGDVAPRE